MWKDVVAAYFKVLTILTFEKEYESSEMLRHVDW
jgi:hypothetical protein